MVISSATLNARVQTAFCALPARRVPRSQVTLYRSSRAQYLAARVASTEAAKRGIECRGDQRKLDKKSTESR